jgi:hypothetical protein
MTSTNPAAALDNLQAMRGNLQNFLKRINQDPNPAEVQVNAHAGNTKYLPISYLEMQLDEYFFGLWETRDFRFERMGNEIMGSLTLRVFHPVALQWIERQGVAATMIRLKSGSKSYELENKIANALEMDAPHLKADCLRNAVQSLGKLFGRDLNRKFTDIYKPLLHMQAVASGAITATVDDADMLRKATQAFDEAMEMARMDDRQEQGFRLAFANCETPRRIYDLIDTIRQYIPQSEDPRRVNDDRAKNPAYK